MYCTHTQQLAYKIPFYDSAYPIDLTGGIKFSGCPPVCACVLAHEDAFFDRLAVDF